jgi:hypothetical protein
MKKKYWIGIVILISAMGIFSMFNQEKELSEEELPWYNLPSISEHIDSNLDDNGKLTEEGNKLPDDERRFKDGELRWVSGGMDGAFGQHGGGGNSQKSAKRVADLVKSISQKDVQSRKVELYKLLLEDNLMDFIDPALEKIVSSNVSIEPFLHGYARWLAFQSPDRGPVKFGIALLGLIQDKNDMSRIITLGKHEEFTLFSTVAITNTFEEPEEHLWNLAKNVDGWGKIHIVERLGETQNPEIKKWLVREGYKNSIMYEYLAYTCAVGGGLKDELSEKQIDEELLRGTGDIIEALLAGGPAEDIDVYDDGAEVIRLYVLHLNKKTNQNLEDFLVLHSIKRFLEDDESDWNERTNKGWTENLRSDLLIDIHNLTSLPKWKKLVIENQDTKDNIEFWQVDQAAGILGIDLWDIHWKKLKENPTESGLWYNVMKNANDQRIDLILSLAISELPLNALSTGPSDDLGIGEGYNIHSCLDFILQDLTQFPNKGFELIEAGLRSPVTRNRNMAIKALSIWEVGDWPESTQELLETALKDEPNEDTKKSIKIVLEGEKLEW